MELFLGVDAGGTSTRVAVADERGAVVGRGSAGGGNPTTRGLTAAVASLNEAIRQALRGLDARDVRAAAVGMAGLGENHLMFSDLWRAVGLTVTPQMVGDVDVAFAAGTSEPNGTVLISGTGALAAEVVGHTAVDVADGLGWLVGDEGSAFWLGREGLKAALEELRRPGDEISSLTSAVTTRMLGAQQVTSKLFEPLLAEAYAAPPLSLAALAPLVTVAAPDCPVAAAIVGRAADALVATVARIRAADSAAPVVLAGSVLTTHSPVHSAVCERVRLRWAVEPVVAGDTAAAAAWLAARVSSPNPYGLHQMLLGTA